MNVKTNFPAAFLTGVCMCVLGLTSATAQSNTHEHRHEHVIDKAQPKANLQLSDKQIRNISENQKWAKDPREYLPQEKPASESKAKINEVKVGPVYIGVDKFPKAFDHRAWGGHVRGDF